VIPVPLTALLAVAVTLLLSIGGNLYQWRAAAVGDAEQAAAIVLATEQGKTQALQEAREREAAIAADAAKYQIEAEQAKIERDKALAAERRANTRRLAVIPTPLCAPGKELQDAFNAAARGEQ